MGEAEQFRKTPSGKIFGNPDLCTLEIYHGGEILSDEYFGGEIDYIEPIDRDELSRIEFVRIGKELGYGDIVKIYFKQNGGFVLVQDDSHVLKMVQLMPANNILTLYIVGDLVGASEVHVDLALSHDVRVAQFMNSDEWLVNPSVSGGQDEQFEVQARNITEMLPLRTQMDDCAEDDEQEEDLIEFVDSDYEQDSENEEVELDDDIFEEHVDHPIEEEPQEMGFAGEISSDEANSENFGSKGFCESEGDDNEVNSKQRAKKNRFNPNFSVWKRDTMLKNPNFDVGMQFPNKAELKEAIIHYTCIQGRKVSLKTNDQGRFRAKCVKGCPFVVYASRIDASPTLVIKSLNLEHQCSKDEKVFWLNSKFLAERYAYELRKDPNWSVQGFTAAVLRDFGVEPSLQQIYRAKQRAEKENKGSYVDQYDKLIDYIHQLKATNPHSTVVLETDLVRNKRRFQRLYICLEACKIGWKEGCRPIVGLDGCFIKGPHPGQLLAAVGIDANNGMFPIAYAIVEIENKATWKWFLEQLISDLEIVNSKSYLFVSDKQKGLGFAIADLLPNSEHRHCVRHLYNNFKANFGGLVLKNILWDAARATTIPWWQAHMEKLRIENKDAFAWLKGMPPQHWSRSHFDTFYKCDILLNNLCEAFNASIVKARDKPILTMLETIRTQLMERMANRRVACLKWKSVVGPRIEKILEKNESLASKCSLIRAGDWKYQVTSFQEGQFAVDLAAKSCSCRRWDLCGIPCHHAICCIRRRGHDVTDYVDDCYKKEAYARAYAPIISPMPSMDQWLNIGEPMLPPPYKKQTGRPRKKRVREAGEMEPPTSTAQKKQKLKKWVHYKQSCRKCGKEGHNAKSCERINDGGASASQQQPSMPSKPRQPKQNVKRGGKQPVVTISGNSQSPISQPFSSQAQRPSQESTSQVQTSSQQPISTRAKRGRPWRP